MKKLIGLVVIVAVLVLGSYFGFGMVTEYKIRDSVKVLNAVDNMYAEVKDYNRGLFHATAEVEWNVNVPERVVKSATGGTSMVPAKEYKFTMPLKVSHGPVIFSDAGIKFGLGYGRTDIDLPSKFQEQFDALFTKDSSKPQLDLSVFVNYLAKTRFKAEVPAFQLVGKQGNGKLDWKGMDSSVRMNSDLSSVDGSINLNGMEFSRDTTTVTMEAVTTTYELAKSAYGLFTGTAEVNFPSLMVMDKDKKLFALESLAVDSSSDVSGDVLNSHVNLSLNALFVNNETFGPANIEMAVRNLDAEAMGKINALSQDIQSDDKAKKQRAMMSMMAEVPNLLSKGPQLEISQLEVRLPQGQVSGNLYVSVPQSEKPNIMTLMQGISGKAHLEVPKAVAQWLIADSMKEAMMKNQLQQMMAQQQNDGTLQMSEVMQQAKDLADKRISAMVSSGMVSEKGDMLVVDVIYEQSKLTVNGKPFNPAMMKF